MPAAAVIRRVQALSGITGFKGYVGGFISQTSKAVAKLWYAFETVRLEYVRGAWNASCSGEMHRYEVEHQLRRQCTRALLTLRYESVGSEQD